MMMMSQSRVLEVLLTAPKVQMNPRMKEHLFWMQPAPLQIYRTRSNRNYCKLKGIRMSGPKLGRPSQNNEYNKAIEYQDNVDRIEVERMFSLSKRCYNLGLIKTKLKETTMTSIALSIFMSDLFKIQSRAFLYFLWQLLIGNKYLVVALV
jgi:hypothetical protein